MRIEQIWRALATKDRKTLLAALSLAIEANYTLGQLPEEEFERLKSIADFATTEERIIADTLREI